MCSEIRVLLMNADFRPQNDRLEQGMLELKKAMNTLHQKSVEVDASVEHQFDRHQAWLNRHRGNMEAHQTVIREYGDRIMALESERDRLLARLMAAEGELCVCRRPALSSSSGDGSQEAPFVLEYEDSEYVTPPQTSEQSSGPEENATPIPVRVFDR